MGGSYYDILGVDRYATKHEIKAAYRKLALKYHPDRNKSQKESAHQFVEIINAYKTLIDDEKRQRYDNRLDGNIEYVFDLDDEVSTQESTYQPSYEYIKYYPRQYSRRAYIYGGIFIFMLILVAFFLPFFLMKYSSSFHYKKGMRQYYNGSYFAAMEHFNKSMNEFGVKNGLANYYNAIIMFDHFGNPNFTLKYTRRAMTYELPDSLLTKLEWMTGRCYQLRGETDKALSYFKMVENKGNYYDSALLYTGIILALEKNMYDNALPKFEELLQKNNENLPARYYKGYCHQKLNEHQKALDTFSSLEYTNFNPGQVLFHKAISEIKLNMRDQACHDLEKASQYAVQEADKLLMVYCYRN